MMNRNSFLKIFTKGFIRNGANLSKKDQDTLKVLNQKLSVLNVKFGQNVLSENNSYKLFVTKKEDLKRITRNSNFRGSRRSKSSRI